MSCSRRLLLRVLPRLGNIPCVYGKPASSSTRHARALGAWACPCLAQIVGVAHWPCSGFPKQDTRVGALAAPMGARRPTRASYANPERGRLLGPQLAPVDTRAFCTLILGRGPPLAFFCAGNRVLRISMNVPSPSHRVDICTGRCDLVCLRPSCPPQATAVPSIRQITCYPFPHLSCAHSLSVTHAA